MKSTALNTNKIASREVCPPFRKIKRASNSAFLSDISRVLFRCLNKRAALKLNMNFTLYLNKIYWRHTINSTRLSFTSRGENWFFVSSFSSCRRVDHKTRSMAASLFVICFDARANSEMCTNLRFIVESVALGITITSFNAGAKTKVSIREPSQLALLHRRHISIAMEKTIHSNNDSHWFGARQNEKKEKKMSSYFICLTPKWSCKQRHSRVFGCFARARKTRKEERRIANNSFFLSPRANEYLWWNWKHTRQGARLTPDPKTETVDCWLFLLPKGRRGTEDPLLYANNQDTMRRYFACLW